MRFGSSELQRYLPHAAVGAAAFAIGLGVGWHLANWKRSLKPKTYTFVKIEEETPAEQQMALDFTAPVEVQEVEVIETTPFEEEFIVVEEDEAGVVISIFPSDHEEDLWDYDIEVPKRTPKRPYIIHRDEFFSNEMDFSQSTITYYAGDDVLCDEADVPVYDAAKIAGDLIFGHGSQDPNIVFVRNEELRAEYEVLRDPGSYQREILGAEIEHSFNRKKDPIPRFVKE